MSATALPSQTLFADYFRANSPYITAPPAALDSGAASLLPTYQESFIETRAEKQQDYIKVPSKDTVRNTVRFAEDTKPPIISTTTKMAPSNTTNHTGNTKSASAGSNSSACRSDSSGNRATETRELTAVDKKWGVLFSPDGQPTARFVEAMTSLSRYIVNAFLMAESIVLVPEKLYSFYNFHTVDKDPFQYKAIFQSRHQSLAEFYQDIGCTFHLVQACPSSPPRIPGLTPEGFARWMALQAQAFPDEVMARLEKAISDFPLEAVSAIDGKSERLPKQLSRYLLPKTPDYRIRTLLQQAVKRHFGEAALVSVVRVPAPATAPKPSRDISFSDGEDDTPRRKPDAIISEHRRFNSYSGPASPQSDRGRDQVTYSKGRRNSRQDARRDVSRSQPRQDRRSSADVGDDTRSAPQASQQAQHPNRYHRNRHSYDSKDSYTSRRSSDRTRSPAGPRPQHSQHRRSTSSVSGSAAPFGCDNRSGRDGRDGRDGRESRDSRDRRNPAPSLFSSFLQSARSTSARRTRSPVRGGPGPLDRKPSSSSRRGASPQPRGHRASLPEIHNSGMDYSGSGYGRRDSASRDVRDTRGHACEPSSRRSSYIGSSRVGSIDTPPSSISDRVDRGDDKKPKLRDVCYKAIERRDRDDKNYRMYGSTMPLSPLSTSPVLQYATSAGTQDKSNKNDGDEKTRSESANIKAKLVDRDTRKSPAVPNSSAPGRRAIPRPLSSLQATVDDRHDEDGNGSDSDQTWDEYLRSEDSH